jgi:hypothetical protein
VGSGPILMGLQKILSIKPHMNDMQFYSSFLAFRKGWVNIGGKAALAIY